MSSIRLFILSCFAELGPMHGHRLRLEASAKHLDLWTDISVGAVYGAMKRLATEGLLNEVVREREGNWPTRQIYEITGEGRSALTGLRTAGLSEFWFKFDPFDLALSRSDPDGVNDLPTMLAERLKQACEMLAKSKVTQQEACAYIGLAQEWALRHTQYRLEAEVAYLTDLLAAVDAIVADERDPRPRKPKVR